MQVRFYTHPATGRPHIEEHGVSTAEVLEVLRGRTVNSPGRDGTRVSEGQTFAGRYLRVISRENETDGSVLVITAYDLAGKGRAAYRRRRRGR